MNPATLRARILENASISNRLTAAIHDTFEVRDRDAASYAAWKAATAEFHARYDRLAFPGGYEGALERIESGDAETIEAAVVFLEVRPFFFRSGYMRTALLRRIVRLAPGTPYQARVAAILVEQQARRAARHRD
jgi:hypothetical protein